MGSRVRKLYTLSIEMANTLATSIGSINNTSQTPLGLGTAYDTKYATYLKLFSGELFKAYESATIAKGTVQTHQLKNGKSLQFIFTGRMTADYHEPGTPILGSGDPPVAEKTIVCDDLLVSSAFVYDLDETLAHYSLRSEISAKIGHALAEAYDKKVFRTIALAAREAHPITAAPGPEPGGSVIQIGSGNQYDAQKLVDAFFEAAAILDEKNLPKSGRTAVLNSRQGLVSIAGISIKRSNNLPFQAGTIAAVSGENNAYNGAFADHAGLIYQKDAAACVEAIGPQVQTTGNDIKTMYQGDIIVGRLAMGPC